MEKAPGARATNLPKENTVDLPYIHTHQDADGTEVITTVAHDLLMISAAGKSMWTCPPTGPDAVAFARAVLAAAGDTGHEVVSVASVSELARSAEEEGARSMRERATLAADHADTASIAAAEIRGLPLLSDTDA